MRAQRWDVGRQWAGLWGFLPSRWPWSELEGHSGQGLCLTPRPPLAPGIPLGPLLRGAVGQLTRALLSCRALGISVTDYTFEDCQLALAEGQLRLPADTCLLEFARLVRGLG